MPPSPRSASPSASTAARDIESWALTEAARRLIDASRNPSNQAALAAALALNQELWTMFQAAISADDCPLPGPVRENLAALVLVVERETAARLLDLDGNKLDTLIQINRSVATGLAQPPADTPGRTPTG